MLHAAAAHRVGVTFHLSQSVDRQDAAGFVAPFKQYFDFKPYANREPGERNRYLTVKLEVCSLFLTAHVSN